jgi:hypothetical protein
MGKLIVDNGKLDISSVAGLTKEELRNWIDARLHGVDMEVPGDFRQGEPPHYLITLIYPELDRNSRDYIRDIVHGFLRDMARNQESSWRGDAAHALLLLAQKLGDRTLIFPIQEMADEIRFYEEHIPDGSADLHRRLLQSLVALEWRGTTDFWHKHIALDAERYAGVAFAGIAQIALQHAIDLLPDLPWNNQNVQAQMRVALRGLLPARDHSVIAESLITVKERLSASNWSLIQSFLPELQRFMDNGPSWDYGSAKDVLRDLGLTDFSSRTSRMTESANAW